MTIRTPIFLVGDEQNTPETIADLLAQFVSTATKSIHIAIYDFRLRDARAAAKVVGALTARADAGVEVRIAYDHRNGPKFGLGDDPAPHGTHEFLGAALGGTGVQLRPIEWKNVETKSIEGAKLMHDKYVVVDGHTKRAAVWTGSTNFTDDAWTRQDNNILVLESPALSACYETDFNELWSTGNIAGTGVNDFATVTSDGVSGDIAFSPGEGRRIDAEIAQMILGAKEAIHLASMLITSTAIVDALAQVLEAGRVPVRGIVDGPQMDGSQRQMAKSPASAAKLAKVVQLRQVLAAKRSTPYSPNGVHDFMHNKVLVVDDAVLTGSYNFSLSAEHNAENAILVRDRRVAEVYRTYVDGLVRKYAA
jgi:phosphatidylserine/phosphatidylglycerophosphate/cardiolipin synthase-like enzyme